MVGQVLDKKGGPMWSRSSVIKVFRFLVVVFSHFVSMLTSTHAKIFFTTFCLICRIFADLLKVIFFARSEFSLIKFCAELCTKWL